MRYCCSQLQVWHFMLNKAANSVSRDIVTCVPNDIQYARTSNLHWSPCLYQSRTKNVDNRSKTLSTPPRTVTHRADIHELARARHLWVQNFNTEFYENPVHSLMDNRRSQRDVSTWSAHREFLLTSYKMPNQRHPQQKYSDSLPSKTVQ